MEEPNRAAWVHSKLGVAVRPDGELFCGRIESGGSSARAEDDSLFGIENDLVDASAGIACAAVSLPSFSSGALRDRVRKFFCFSGSLIEPAKPVGEMVRIPGVVGIQNHIVGPDKTPVPANHIRFVDTSSRQVILGHYQASGRFTRRAGTHLEGDF